MIARFINRLLCHRAPAATCAVLGIVILGSTGFWQVNGGEGGWGYRGLDALYRTIQTFGLNFDMPGGACEPGPCTAPPAVNWQIQTARFLAAGCTFFAVLLILTARISDSLWLYWQSRFARRQVLLGFGQVNRAIAAALVNRPEANRGGFRDRVVITAVDRSVTGADRRAAAAADVLLIEGDIRDPALIGRLRLDRAEKIFVAAGSDTLNIEVATALATARPGPASDPAPRSAPALCAHVGDLRLAGDLTEARDSAAILGGNFQTFNLSRLTAQDFVTRSGLARRARDHRQRRVHLVIVGAGDDGEAILEEALLSAYATDLKPPRLTFLDPDPDAVRTRLKARYPRLFDQSLDSLSQGTPAGFEGPPLIEVRQFDLATTDLTDCAELDALDRPLAKATAWVFCAPEDQTNLSLALRLEAALLQRTSAPPALFVQLRQTPLPRDTSHHGARLGLAEAFGNLQQVFRTADLLSQEPDWLARMVHSAYARIGSTAARGASRPEAQFDGPWDRLPENVKEANRRLVRSLAGKLSDLGLDWRGAANGTLPRLTVDRAAVRNLTAEDILKALGVNDPQGALQDAADLEHMRWVIDRALSGWQQGGPDGTGAAIRDNRRRRHTDMVPGALLAKDKKPYDHAALDAILPRLAPHDGNGQGWLGPPLAAGHCRSVTEIAADAPSAFDAAALARCTELRVRFADKPDGAGIAQIDDLRQTIARWSKQDCATRLHLLLGKPVFLPMTREPGAADAMLPVAVAGLLRAVDPGIDVRITRDW